MDKDILPVDIVLVNEKDEPMGTMEKMEAHRKGLLHRAFSVFIFNSKGEMLLQQRAMGKYHSAGLWTNACCSHPKPGETTQHAAERRLREELGFSVAVDKVFEFVYKADFDNGLTENEFDHVFTGLYDGAVQPDPDEVMAFRWLSPGSIRKELEDSPEKYTAWFIIAFPALEKHLAAARPSSPPQKKDTPAVQQGIDPELLSMFKKIINGVSAVVLWALITMSLGIYLGWAFIYESFHLFNGIFYGWFVLSLGALVYYIVKIWNK